MLKIISGSLFIIFYHIILSRPLLLCLLEEYWFLLSRYVYDRNRPLAPIIRQSRCSLMYDVY
jgi:hypothetical protein